MSTTLYILEKVVREIHRDIAAYPPERGGAILGPVGQPIITHFILDELARTSRASYTPSLQLTDRVQQIESKERLEFKGVIHSHPGGLDQPTGPDEEGMIEGLNLNPHIQFFIAPIVTLQPPRRDLGSHEVLIDEGKISFYAAYRAQSGVRVQKIPVQQIDERELAQMLPMLPNRQLTVQSSSPKHLLMKADLERICHTFGSAACPETFVAEIEGHSIPAGRVILRGNLELLFLFSESYPIHAPVLLVTSEGGDTKQVDLPWSLETPALERLLTALKKIFNEGSGSYQEVYGPMGKSPLTADSAQAGLAGWVRCYSGTDPKLAASKIQEGLFARSQGLLSKHISSKRVLIAGTGSVGSYIAEQLTRSGVGAFTLIDPETVELANLSRTTYDVTDVERPKVEALSRRLLHINPLVELTPHHKSLSDFNVEEFDALVQQADLIVGATDDPDAQRNLNRFAYHRGKSALFVGLYKGAEGGEVIYTIPERTPCYLCSKANHHQAQENFGTVERDYGTGRLVGEMALSADIHHVSSVAVKMALSLLLPEDADVKLKGFLNPMIESKLFYLTLSMVPNYWFYPCIFEHTPGQSAYQSVWMTPERGEECPVCGNGEHRRDPHSVSLRKPSAHDILAAAQIRS